MMRKFIKYILTALIFWGCSDEAPIPAPTITDVAVSNISKNSARVTFTVSPSTPAARSTGLEIENYKTVSGGDNNGSISIDVTGLSSDSYYSFKAFAEDRRGNRIYSETQSFKTEPAVKNYTETASSLNFDMIAVEKGTFTMGCTGEQGSDCQDNEKPAHPVTLSDFYIGKYEVTQGLWYKVMGSYSEKFNSEWGAGNNYPMYYVNWDEIQTFISKLNTLTGKRYRLPTEAEWEYAARGGNKSQGYKYSGSNNVDNVAWHDGNSGMNSHTVGTKSPNELGIYDMTGNVLEFCHDWYGAYSSSSQINPVGPSAGSYRVIRGGNFFDNLLLRVSSRDNFRIPFPWTGFRLAHSAN